MCYSKCGEEGHMCKDCTNEERFYTFTHVERLFKWYTWLLLFRVSCHCQLQFNVQDFYEVAKFDKRTKLEELMQDPERNPKERTLIFVQVKIGTLNLSGIKKSP